MAQNFRIKSLFATLLLAATLSMGRAYTQTIPSGYIPRTARMTSVVNSANRAKRVPTKLVAQDDASMPEMEVIGELGPPMPPSASQPVPAAQIINAPMNAEPFSISSVESYPATDAAPYIEQAPVYDAPYAEPLYESVVQPGTPVGGGYGCANCDGYGCDGSGCAAGPTCGAGGYGCESCGGGCTGSCGNGCYHWIDTLSLNVGVQGFKNGINRGESGSFGFQEGVNWGSPWVFTPLGMNTQIGFRATQTDFHGAAFTTEHRAQYFVTAGFYKRNCQGLQGGIVFDYLHDDWYTTIDVSQVRGELSIGAPTGNSMGFALSQSVSDDDTTSILNGLSTTESWDTQDYYRLFWEKQSNQQNGRLRIFGGATGEADAIFGTNMQIPLFDNWSFQSEFTYLVPNEGAAQGGTQNEAWNVAFNLVWYPARSMGRVNYAMLPMFDVAGNGSMITHRKTP